ncbi:MAG: hypothetical protein KDC98_12365 [Planctomycetes bacterium]|nr:hypothetical protein [Planctomycetota bacterium]
MTKLLTNVFFAALTSALLAPATAQNLDSHVTQDPNAGLAIYDFHFNGPPRGVGYLLFSLRQSPGPLQFPGIYGGLMIDPLYVAPYGFTPLDGLGQGGLQLLARWPVANGLPLFAQGVMLDQASQLAFTNFTCSAIFDVNVPLAAGMGVAADYVRGNINVNITGGPANGNVTVWVNGGQKATGMLVLGANGSGSISVPVPGGMQRGDQVTILVNGQPVRTWRH